MGDRTWQNAAFYGLAVAALGAAMRFELLRALQVPLMLLVIHWIADFRLQANWMAMQKSESTWNGISALTLHVTVYSLCFLWFGLLFVWWTFATHFVTDAITSRVNSYLYRRDMRHLFFVSIGFDQLIHATTLALTWKWLT